MKKLFGLLMIGFITLMFVSCGTPTPKQQSTDEIQKKQTEQLVKEAAKEVGMPAITNFQEKKTLKWIYELCDQADLVCYAYLFNEFKGEVGQYLGRCIGYGVPYSTQYVNPERIWMETEYWRGSGSGSSSYNDVGGSIPQPEPNGLFKPDGMSATWLIMIDPETETPTPVYVEPTIIVSPFPLHK